MECTRVSAEALKLVEQDRNEGRHDPDAQQDLEDGQDELQRMEKKLQKKSTYLSNFVITRNGEMAGDGTRAVRRLMSRQYQETFNLSVAAAAATDAAAVTADAAAPAAAATDAADAVADAVAVPAVAAAATDAAFIDLTAAAVATAQVCTDQYSQHRSVQSVY